MKYRTPPLTRLIGIATIALASTGAHAACTTIGSSSTVGFNMAVASNFYLSAQSIATSFLAIGPKNYNIYICEGSSQALYDSIVPTNAPQYALFLSADEQRPDDLYKNTSLTLAAPFDYAKGTPVFLLSTNAYNATSGNYRARNYLNQSVSPGGATAQSSVTGESITNNVSIKKSSGSPIVTDLAIGNPDLAPYGVAAQSILTAMGLWATSTKYDAGTNTSTSCATLSSGKWICKYDNINITLDAINNNSVTAGFVSYGQVCPALKGSTYPVDKYVLFPAYPTIQDGVQLKVQSDSTAETKAADFKTYMLGGAGSTDWNTWLTDHCYQAL